MLTRLERRNLIVPKQVSVDIDSHSGQVTFKAESNSLIHTYNTRLLQAKVEEGVLAYSPIEKAIKINKREVAAHLGTAIAISANHLEGLMKPFVIELVLKGTGYKVALKKQGQETILVFNLGKSHEDVFVVPVQVNVNCPSATEVQLQSSDKQLLGQVASNIRRLRAVDPYKGKGVLFKGQVVSLKETKKK